MDKAANIEGAVAGKGRAVFRIVIDGSQQAIFEELTSLERPLGAIFNARMATTGLKRGGRIQMRTVSGRHTIVDGDILEYDPPHRFVHTHRFTQYDDPVSIVTYELRPVAGGIEVTLTVDDLPLGTKTATEMQRGGDFMLKTLKAIVEQGRPAFGTRLMYWMFGALEFVLPARSKAQHWPLEGPRK
ncbi:MAG TPA: SRPBCC domain-containing protein [Usitatibacter sp.]|nr:SRPBCC domain-containing protein [Usitatibacter sp.]